MSNRWLRFVVAVLALATAGGATARILQQQRLLSTELSAGRAADQTAESIITTLSEIKAGLHATLVSGQSQSFWSSRTAQLLDRLHAALLELDNAIVATGGSLKEALDLADRLAAARERAERHLGMGQALLAGDAIFTDARDIIDGLKLQTAGVREQLARATDTRQLAIRKEQAYLVAAAGGVLALALLFLVPPGRTPGRETVLTELSVSGPPPDVDPREGHAPSPPTPTHRWTETAELCTDLGRVSEASQLAPLLSRAAHMLDASGVVVWIASDAGDSLQPVAYFGYDERTMHRIGALRTNASNLTSDAFRGATTVSRVGRAGEAAALAIPLLAVRGAVGVLAAEFRDATGVDEERLALATIVAAQLAMLLGGATDAPPLQQAQA
ncbi:MAG: GAF domain-containing protein [Acidobacteriota bacterium]